MYIVNDINRLLNLAKFKILDLLPIGDIAISKFKIYEYGIITRQQLNNYSQIGQLHVDELEMFSNWRSGKNQRLTDGDLSTIYIALKNPPMILLLSDEDLFLPNVCVECGVPYKQWDEVIGEIADEKTIELYHLIKTA